jgi:hypothetical protein
VSFTAITLCVAFQRVFVAVYFVIDSVRKLLDTTSYSVILCIDHNGIDHFQLRKNVAFLHLCVFISVTGMLDKIIT